MNLLLLLFVLFFFMKKLHENFSDSLTDIYNMHIKCMEIKCELCALHKDAREVYYWVSHVYI